VIREIRHKKRSIYPGSLSLILDMVLYFWIKVGYEIFFANNVDNADFWL